MKNEFLKFSNKKDGTLVIDIDGIIGADWWSDSEKANTKERIKKAVKEIAQSTASHIICNINSYGGDVNHGVSIHDVLAVHKAKVTTRITGHTASAATIVAQAGDKREISDNALFLIHQASTIALGNKEDIKTVLSDLEKVDETLINIYVKRSGKTVEEITELMDRFDGRGEWLTAVEAQDMGLVDTVFEPMKVAAMIQNSELTKFGLPSLPESKIKQNQKENIMKIKFQAAWSAIASFFNWKDEEREGQELTEEMVGQINDELQIRQDRITALEGEASELEAARDTAISDLETAQEAHNTALIAMTAERDTALAALEPLQAEIAQLKGDKTNTKSKEDPSLDTSNLSPNELAAQNNAVALRDDE